MNKILVYLLLTGIINGYTQSVDQELTCARWFCLPGGAHYQKSSFTRSLYKLVSTQV